VATSTDPASTRAFVVDASVCLPWLLIDERTLASEALYRDAQRSTSWAPPIWRLEMANALVVAERRGRIRPEVRAEILATVDRLGIRIDELAVPVSALAELALQHGLTAYDAAYLELARRRGLPLATFDDALRRAAPVAGVALYEI